MEQRQIQNGKWRIAVWRKIFFPQNLNNMNWLVKKCQRQKIPTMVKKGIHPCRESKNTIKSANKYLNWSKTFFHLCPTWGCARKCGGGFKVIFSSLLSILNNFHSTAIGPSMIHQKLCLCRMNYYMVEIHNIEDSHWSEKRLVMVYHGQQYPPKYPAGILLVG